MDMDTALQPLLPWFAATGIIENWAAGARALALLRAGLSSGILDAVQQARTLGELAAITGIETDQMADICAALDAHDVIDHIDGRYVLSPAFATLLAPDVFQTLSAIIEARMADVRALESATAPERAYTTLGAEDLLAVAEGVTLRPAAAPARDLWHAFQAEGMPEVHTGLEAGGHWAEFGCGVGGGLLSTLLMYPTCTAVGMEIQASVIKETRKRAVELGVAHRVDLRHIDVGEVSDAGVFDAGFWSQSFFPRPSRSAAMTAILRSLKPGGYLIVPGFEGGEPPSSDAEVHGPENRAFSLNRLVYGRWGIPAPTAPELRTELEGAGFEFVRCVPLLIWQYLLMRRPLA